ncbi:lantibiotic ABC transporter permease [Candidatus Parcubacteria bacterium]|nr:MAG: lantibiotic ABC transporter permease [Candidatus Parcubacteria bacterium]
MKKNFVLKIAVTIAYFAMIIVNYLANALPIGGVTTGQASDNFANLFTPAGITFSIWGLIYLLLLGYTIYQFNWKKNKNQDKLFKKINKLFLLTSLANMAWIFAWHYGIIWLSLLIMIALLTLLIKIADIVNHKKQDAVNTIFVRLPFSIYFGWITIATIANVTVFLQSINWNGFGISDQTWMIVVLFVGAAIGIIRMFKDKNIYYGLVLVWAYFGIWIKHTSLDGFNSTYPNIINVVVFCIALFIINIGYLGYKKLSYNQGQ